jgi:sec-independent protein translocase protein TatC
MVALAIAMVLLFELAVQIARIHDKRAAARLAGTEEDYSKLDDDDVSPLDIDTTAEEPSPTPAAAPPEKPGRSNYDDVT